MRITDVEVRVVHPPDFTFRWRRDLAPVQLTMPVVRIRTDEGPEGVAIGYLPGGPNEIGEVVAHFLRPLLVGSDPFDRERLWHEMMGLGRYMIDAKGPSLVDIALWDLAGHHFGVPVHVLLGTYRDAVPAYRTVGGFDTVEEHVERVRQVRDERLRGAKLHGYNDLARDIELVRAVREGIGDDGEFLLLFDATSSYRWEEAIRLGRVLDELGFHWFEDPVRDDDLAGLRELSRKLDLTVLMGEATDRGPWPYATFIAQQAGDAYRVVGDSIGGITGMRKVGALTEANNRSMELHSYGTTLVQAAHLHYMLSARNSTLFEVPTDPARFSFGMRTTVEIDADGLVRAPAVPGLGYEVDWDVIEDATVTVL